MQEKIQREFSAVIGLGVGLLNSSDWQDYDTGDAEIDHYVVRQYLQFRTRAANLIERLATSGFAHAEAWGRVAKKERDSDPSYLPEFLGVIEAAAADFQAGLLFDLKAQLQADVFGDFIEQAQALLDAGLVVPAASLAGAVLEDTLRKLCEKHSVAIPEKSNIEKLNTALVKAVVYNVGVQKTVTAYAHTRNSADHGKFDDVNAQAVDLMVQWLRGFVGQHLGRPHL